MHGELRSHGPRLPVVVLALAAEMTCARAALSLLLYAATLATPAQARAADAGAAPSSEYALSGGALVPSKVPGVREVLPVWDLRASFRTRRGVFEGDFAAASASGVTYYATGLNYRYDLKNDVIPAFVLLGAHADSYRGENQSEMKFSGGWNFGGGIFAPLAGPLWLRSDFRYRFGPGQSLLVLVGFSIRLSDSGGA